LRFRRPDEDDGKPVSTRSVFDALTAASAPASDVPGIIEYAVGEFQNIDNLEDALNYLKALFDLSLVKLDSLFPQPESDAQIPVRRRVEVGFDGDNGVQILSGLSPGDKVVLNP